MADTYSHDPKKFSDTGLQLRMPVDLVPSTQYSRLTNAETIIEGELVARNGVTEIADLANINAIILFDFSTAGLFSDIVHMTGPNNFAVGS